MLHVSTYMCMAVCYSLNFPEAEEIPKLQVTPAVVSLAHHCNHKADGIAKVDDCRTTVSIGSRPENVLPT